MKQHIHLVRQCRLSSVYGVLLLASCLSMTSCNKDQNALSVKSINEGETEVRLGASINLRTRATDSGFELNDSIGLYLNQWKNSESPESLQPSGNYADNVLYELTATPDSWTPEKKSYYPVDGSLLDFQAYYPYRQPAFTEGTKLSLQVAPDQTQYIDYTRSDFMTAKAVGVERRAEKVHLDFYHRLSQITFTLKAGIGLSIAELKDAEIRIINAITNGTYDLQVDSILQAGTNRGDMIPYGEWTDTTSNTLAGKVAILIPQEVNTNTYLQVTIGHRNYTYKPHTPNQLESGYSQEFIITVNHSDLDIETQIHPWSTKPAINGNAEEETEVPETDVIVTMTTLTPDTISMQIIHQGDIIVNWGDNKMDTNRFFHVYSDKAASHEIKFKGEDSTLISFTCREAKLTTLDITKNKALKTLKCDANQLTTLDVSQNIILDTLACSMNVFKTLDVSKNIKLVYFDCSSNQISTIDLSNHNLLRSFSCVNTSLSSLDISNNPQIKNIYCATTPLCSDNTALLNLVNSLPACSENDQGYLYIGISSIPQEIQAICSSKNWFAY